MTGRRRVVVVGAGPAGLAAAGRLVERGRDAVEVVLAAPGVRATFLPGTLDVALGAAEPERFTFALRLQGVRNVDGAVDRAAPDGVAVAGDWLPADAVIAAPGLALESGAVSGWSRAAPAWDPVSAARARALLADLSPRRLLVAACTLPYRCPPAPFALGVGLADRLFRAPRMTRVTVSTPEPIPLAGVGGEAPALVLEACAAAGVMVERAFVVDLQGSEDGLLRATDGRTLPYEAAVLVPPHVRAACLHGLPGDGPLVQVGDRGAVDGSTLYVAGDAAASTFPRAAGVARATATAAADGALEALGIAPAPPPAPVEASCFMFHRGGAVSRIRARFSHGEANVDIDGPSLDLAPAREGERRRFEAAAGRDGGRDTGAAAENAGRLPAC